ncbi:hypothetical protein, partial [Propylenella binzhouense]|uniref:hypothetical protein n=1 Tax=Propylenella binzhouense TaxID=2555902 RepID=UPI0019684146
AAAAREQEAQQPSGAEGVPGRGGTSPDGRSGAAGSLPGLPESLLGPLGSGTPADPGPSLQ